MRERRHSLSGWIRLSAGIAFALAAASAGAALDQAGWKHRQDFEVPQAGLIKLPLPVETLDLAQPALSDLRVIGPSGQEIPYRVETGQPPAPGQQPPHGFRVQLEKLSTVLLLETGTDAPLESIELVTTAPEFVKAARIELSADREQWEVVGEGFPLARQHGTGSVALPCDRRSARFVRITIDDWRTPPVAFSGAVLRLAAAGLDPAVPLPVVLASGQEFAHETVLTLELPARQLPLAWIEFDIAEPRFARRVTIAHRTLQNGELSEQSLAGGTIIRAGEAGREALRLALDCTTPERELLVHIVNDDNAPLTVRRVTLHRRPVSLILTATERGTHGLLTGHTQIAAPVYDLDAFAADFRGLPEATISVSAARPNPAFHTTEAPIDTPWQGVPIDVAKWKFQKTVTPAVAGVQELELDPEVLAHAQSSLADLRLVRDGRQVPYLLERSELRRTLRVKPVGDDDPQRPDISRWKLALPLAGIPLTRITLASDTPVFSRSVRLFETVADPRGNLDRRLLGSAQWSSTPAQRVTQLAIELSRLPQTDGVWIEMDNGDNPPIALGDARAEYRVVRLLFWSDAHPLQLHYGFPGATAPRYDLALVARQILREEKQPAALGPEKPAQSGGGHALLSGIRGGALLWSVLGLVVVVLLVLIARLLPKTPPRDR